MAITAIWDIKDSLKRVINYASNKEKTEIGNDDLMNSIQYISHDVKTEDKQYVTGINCSLKTAYDEMTATKRNFGKESGILAFHAIQAFIPGEITPEKAHEIGIELANKLWGDRFEVIVATHTDKKHIHSHFVINSVSFVDGKRYYDNKKTYYEFQKTSDQLCLEYRLSVITPKGKKEPYALWYAKKNDKPTNRSVIAQDVEIALESSLTMNDFIRNLSDLGYQVKQGKHLAIKPSWAKTYYRLYKLDQDKYSDESLKERILNNNFISLKSFAPARCDYHPEIKRQKLKGFKALYFKYLYLFGVLPKDKPRRRPHTSLKNEWQYLDEISREATFIGRYNIETMDDLNRKIDELKSQIHQKSKQRSSLYYKKKHCFETNQALKIDQDRRILSEQIKELRKELKTCVNIKERSAPMQKKVDSIEKEEAKKGERKNVR